MSTKKLNNENLLIVGLGNPKKMYQNTYHNAGAIFINWLKKHLNSEEFKINKKVLAEISLTNKNDKTIILAKPTTFMNNSGQSVKKLKTFFKVKNKNLYLAHDDSDLILGSFKIQFQRGSAGHKGVESVINSLKTKDFYRIRIGIRPPHLQKVKAEKFVLQNLSLKEKEILEQVFEKILRNLEAIGVI